MIRLQLKMMKGAEEQEGRTGYDERKFRNKRAAEIKGRGTGILKGKNIKKTREGDSTGGKTGKREISKQKIQAKKKGSLVPR